MSLHEALATPERKRAYVRTLFRTIAGRYDLITVLLSFGLDRSWKRRVVSLVTGTGDLAYALARQSVSVVGLDIVPEMIERARAKAPGHDRVRFTVGDMTALPFIAGRFSVVTTGYGLRNVPDLAAAIDEMLRVLEPGGCLVSLDFDRPSGRWLRAAYLCYLSMVGGVLGWLLHRDPDTYRYIPASIRTYPGAAAVARLMAERGFVEVAHHPVLGGLMAIHTGRKRCG
jgi:demethylmenaquinone methyltransferase/2-methoxy-6-polyprenyl-1,4-benzoquinol methylase